MSNDGLISGLDTASFETGPYAKFVTELRSAISSPQCKNVDSLLDGLAGQRCLALLGSESIHRLGAFFTPSHTAEKIISRFSVKVWSEETAFDPACGAGDLLLPVARRLPVKPVVSSTLQCWNQHLSGCDLSSEFVEAAQLRLVLLAIQRGAIVDGSISRLTSLLSNLKIADGLAVSEPYSASTCIMMNPPYGRVPSGKQLWRDGSVTAAALFLERAARLSRSGAQIVALLPEVLRTGSSYKRWREVVKALLSQAKPHSIGVFSNDADVDVFVQHFVKRDTPLNHASIPPKTRSTTLGDLFLIAVGAVVPHRHPLAGPKFSFLRAQKAVPWGELRRINESRKFTGRTFTPPFAVVRRTSRPGDHHRAIATIVLGKRPVAVDNHLIVLTPRDGTIEACRALVEILRSRKTDIFLDRTMRCRHLTTGSVASLPWG